MTTQRTSRRQGTAVTIADVARHAGVSPMTVSRVINGEGKVRGATRETVEAAIAALNYSPNMAARALAGAQPVRIGFLYDNPSAGFLSDFLVGSLDYAARNNLQLVIEKCARSGADDAEVAMRRLLDSGVEGLVLLPPLCDSAALIDALRVANGWCVTVASGLPAPGFSAVGVDDRAAAYAMTDHLTAMGHRRIGFITGNPNQTGSALRLAGYHDALTAAGIAIDDSLIAPGLYTYRSGLEAAATLLDRNDPPTAIFAGNDDMAAAAVAVAHRLGFDVPNDLSICGFDDIALATTIWPELTTIHQPILELSLAAVELLAQELRQRRIGAEIVPQNLRLDFRLVRRQSDGVARDELRRGAPTMS